MKKLRVPDARISKAWQWYFIVVGLLSVAYVTSPLLHRGAFFTVLSFLPVVAILAGLKNAASDFKRPWAMWAVGQTLFAAGDLIAYTQPHYKFPGPSDILYLAVYPFFIGGAVMLLDRYRDASLRKSHLDEFLVGGGTAIAVCAALVALALYAVPTLPEAAVSFAYPALDLAFLGLLYQLRPSNGDRKLMTASHLRRTFIILYAGVICLTVVDLLYAIDQVWTKGYVPGGALDFGWLLFYLALGTVALTTPEDRPFRSVLLPKLTLEGQKAESFELVDLHTGNTVASFHTHEEAREALYAMQPEDDKESLVIIRFDERGIASEHEPDSD